MKTFITHMRRALFGSSKPLHVLTPAPQLRRDRPPLGRPEPVVSRPTRPMPEAKTPIMVDRTGTKAQQDQGAKAAVALETAMRDMAAMNEQARVRIVLQAIPALSLSSNEMRRLAQLLDRHADGMEREQSLRHVLHSHW